MLIVLFSLFFILLFMNLPVAFSIGISSMFALCFYGDLPLSAVVTRMYSGVDSFTLLAIPFFINTILGDLFFTHTLNYSLNKIEKKYPDLALEA